MHYTQWPFIGASPNGIILCQCHDDTGALETKYLYCHHHDAIDSAAIKDTNASSACKSRMMALYFLTVDMHTITLVCNANFCVYL